MISTQEVNEVPSEGEASPHQITLLRHPTLRVRKQRAKQPDGSIKKLPAEIGKHWDVLLVPGETLDDLQAALTSKENVIFVHGVPAPGLKTHGALKNGKTILEQANPFQLFDVDGLPVPNLEPAAAARHIRDTFLAPEFHGADCFYAATAGHGDEGLARMRLGFATSRPVNRDESRAWAKRCPAPPKKLDTSIYTPSQPVFIGLDFIGCEDPFKNRTGRVGGKQRVEVPDDLHADAARVYERATKVAAGAVPDAPHMVEKFCASIYQRDSKAFENVGGRHKTALAIAYDAGDLYITQQTCETIIECLFMADDDSQADLEERLRELKVANPVAVAGQVRRAGEAIADEWTAGADDMDIGDVVDKLAEGYRYRQLPLGCKFTLHDDGGGFGAVDDEEYDEPRAALDAWLASPSDLGAYEALVSELTSKGIKRQAASRAIRDAQLGAMMGVDDEAGVVALRALTAAPKGAAIFDMQPFSISDFTTIEPRRFVFGHDYIRRFVSSTVSPGGRGKSSLVIAESCLMAIGLTFDRRPAKPLRVCFWCFEDPREEIELRVAAWLQHNGFTADDLGGRLTIQSGRDVPLKLVGPSKDGPGVSKKNIDRLIATIRAKGFDVLTLDPAISLSLCSENDNIAGDLLAKQLGRVAGVTDTAIMLVAHARKPSRDGDGQLSIADSRGASAMTDACRAQRVLNLMTKAEGDEWNIAPDERWRYVRVGGPGARKANLAPGSGATWIELKSETILNGRDGYADSGVGVVCAWAPPERVKRGETDLLDELRERIAVHCGNQRPKPTAKLPDIVAALGGENFGEASNRARYVADMIFRGGKSVATAKGRITLEAGFPGRTATITFYEGVAEDGFESANE